MKIVIGYDGSMRSRAAAAMLREQGHIVSAAYVTASSELPAELESKAASDGLFITAVYGDDSTTEGVISALCGHMKAYGFGAAATGHIARVSRDEKVTVDGENGEKQTVIKPCGAPRIAIAVDVPSDESAKLGLLSAETVAKLVLPLGELGAGELAEYAKAHSIHAVAAPDAVPGAHRLRSARSGLRDLYFSAAKRPIPRAAAQCTSVICLSRSALPRLSSRISIFISM